MPQVIQLDPSEARQGRIPRLLTGGFPPTLGLTDVLLYIWKPAQTILTPAPRVWWFNCATSVPHTVLKCSRPPGEAKAADGILSSLCTGTLIILVQILTGPHKPIVKILLLQKCRIPEEVQEYTDAGSTGFQQQMYLLLELIKK